MRAVPCDVADDAACARLVEAATAFAAETDRRFDVLVNNAGIGDTYPAEDEPVEHFERVVDVNLNALFVLSQLAGRHFLAERRGLHREHRVDARAGGVGPHQAGELRGLEGRGREPHPELGCQWSRKGVRVNGIAPGWFRSEMTNDTMFADEGSMAFLTRNCPMGRAGDEHELDGALLFLASDASSYVTGQTLAVDGGWTAR